MIIYIAMDNGAVFIDLEETSLEEWMTCIEHQYGFDGYFKEEI